jgi:2'-5' RNA ligase
MALTELYDNLFNHSIGQISQGDIEIDRRIDDQGDRRRGLTLLIKPSDEVKGQINLFQDEMRKIDAEQYYQPMTDLHVTVLSIISCYEGFDLNQVHVADFESVIADSIRDVPKTEFLFKGITSSRQAVMIQGFPTGDGLDRLRECLRKNFSSSGLQQSIDSRYKLTTAHMTSLRFRKELQSPAKFAERLEDFRTVEFGAMPIVSLDLVYNDWYQNSSIVQLLNRFTL